MLQNFYANDLVESALGEIQGIALAQLDHATLRNVSARRGGPAPGRHRPGIPGCAGGNIDHAMLQNISERKHASKQWLEAKAGIILPLHDHETLQSFSARPESVQMRRGSWPSI